MPIHQDDLLLIVDMQVGFLERGPLARRSANEAVPYIRGLITEHVEQDGQVAFTADCHEEGDPELEVYPPHCMKGTEETQIVDALIEPLNGRNAKVFYKNTFNAGSNPEFIPWVSGQEFRRVVVVGVATDVCLLHTVASLRDAGQRVTVHQRGTSTFDSDWHPAEESKERALEYLSRLFGVEIV